jgi:hypothetical protein
MLKKPSLGVAAAALCTAALVALAGPASAASPSCTTGYSCDWKDIHYVTNGVSGDSFRMFYYVTSFDGFDYAGTSSSVYLSISSEYNAGTGGDGARFFKGISCSGASFTSAAGSGDSDFTNGSPSGSWNDQAASASFVSELANC